MSIPTDRARNGATRRSRIVRTGLFALAALFFAYALSDHPLYGGAPGFGAAQWLIVILAVGLAVSAFFSPETGAGVLLLACVSLIMLGLGEWIGEIVLGPKYRTVFRYDEELIFEPIPSRASIMTLSPANGGESVRHEINQDGFRGPDLLVDSNRPRIVVYGDSFIHAAYTAEEETYAAQLARALREQQGIEAEVVNAGVSSYGPDQILKKMQRELPLLAPDLVIVAIYAGNDYGDLMRNKMYRLGDGGTLVDNDWQLGAEQQIAFAVSQEISILKRAVSTIVNGILASTEGPTNESIDLNWLLDNSKAEYESHVVQGDSSITNTYIDYYNANISLEPGHASSRYEIALMRAVIGRIRALAEEEGVALALLFIPHASDVTDTYDNWVIDVGAYPDYERRNQVAPLESIARDMGIPFVSLFDSFRAMDANEIYLHGGDDHWNRSGQALAATITVSTLANLGTLDALTR